MSSRQARPQIRTVSLSNAATKKAKGPTRGPFIHYSLTAPVIPDT